LFLLPLMISAQQARLKSSPLDCVWQKVGATGFSPGSAENISLAFSPVGEPFVAFKDIWFTEKSFVMKFDGTNWVNVGEEGVSQGRGDYPSFVFSPTGEPWMAFKDYANSYKATVMKFDGSKWVTIGDRGFTESGVGDISLAYSPSGKPYVAYQDEKEVWRATVMKFDYPAGINDLQNSSFTIYPNPTTKTATIDFNNDRNNTKFVELMDVRGVKMFEVQTNEKTVNLNIEKYHPGVYLVKIRMNNSVCVAKVFKN